MFDCTLGPKDYMGKFKIMKMSLCHITMGGKRRDLNILEKKIQYELFMPKSNTILS